MCIPDQNAIDTHLLVPNILSSAAFADDLLCPTSTIQDLKIQARKLTLYSDWAALVILGSKTKSHWHPTQTLPQGRKWFDVLSNPQPPT